MKLIIKKMRVMQVQVTWIDTKHTAKIKVFRSLEKAERFADKLECRDARSETGLYRSIEVDVFC